MADSIHPYWLVTIAGVLAIVPLFVGVATAYVKVSVVVGMLKSGLGTQEAPSMMVTMVLSMAITLVIMAPVIDRTTQVAGVTDFNAFLSRPSLQALGKFVPLIEPWRGFLSTHAGPREVQALSEISRTSAGVASDGEDSAETDSAQPLKILLAAFVLTELREAFTMAFMLLLPFLVIDLVVANVLVGLGMFMVSPVMIALPLKLVLFVLADGWLLLARSLIASYGGG